MSHPGNDERIDNKRDNGPLSKKSLNLVDKMVFTAVEMGIGAVQEIAAKTLSTKPGLSLKEFTKILDDYLMKQQELHNQQLDK